MSGAPFRIGFLLFPDVTQLDFTGPLQVLHRIPNSHVSLIAATLDLVPSDCGLDLIPTVTFDTCPDLDLLCIPGGFGVDDAMRDVATMAFVKRQAQCVQYLTSVCTGAFILGAAGLLKGRKATTHWAYHDDLEKVGAIPTKARVVRDGNVFTGGGVTAGIDFALTVAAEIASTDVAQAIQLGLEYDPAPPFHAGSPDCANSEIVDSAANRYAPRLEAFRKALSEIA